MMKDIPLSKFYRLINHGPTVLVTSAAGDLINIAPVAWATPINDQPAIVGLPIAESHFTTELINKSGQFAVNIPGQELLHAVMHAGRSSGRNENKFASAGLTPVNGVKIQVPHIRECLGYFECSVREKHACEGVVLFIADVLHAQVEDTVFDEYWIPEKAKTVHHLGGGYFATMGKRFKAG